MGIIPFKVEIINEAGYNRLHIKNHAYTGRIRKHLGKMPDEKLESIQFHLKYDLEKHFSQHPITKDSVEYYVEQYISMRIKKSGCIFDFIELSFIIAS